MNTTHTHLQRGGDQVTAGRLPIRTLADGRKTARYWGSDADTRKFQAAGLVCVLACHVRPGDRILSRASLFGMSYGSIDLLRVTDVQHDLNLYCVTIETAITTAEEHEDLPVWIVDPSDTCTGYELHAVIQEVTL